ncbi:hypothetical protein [Halomonas korlensis]|uniref:UbiA prenyltransferase family protein n=1 Tax=Halomonas korlensis TaxID=463301 RepID=A0A1I7F7Z0_9GAMM|nr:hypothetical protein [Halomonas korlensis]SFU32292.1 hypothetical protein SAMN04487955_101296 [Halomonas korlensis]
MKLVYLLPFSYFLNTRLREGSVSFHLVFEWLAAMLLVVVLGEVEPLPALAMAGLSYLAFISLYEIGYLVNDLVAAQREVGGRKRGPQEATLGWGLAWTGSRLIAFMLITIWLDFLTVPAWWSFYLALCLTFSLHNVLQNSELKSATFLWLAWLRFMAPVMFVVEDAQRLGIGLAAAVSYVTFRLLGYLDSKRLLRMPGRQRASFRLFYFLMPLIGLLALWPYAGAEGYMVLTSYFAIVAAVGTLAGPALTRVSHSRTGR